jgi:hypothetical protein
MPTKLSWQAKAKQEAERLLARFEEVERRYEILQKAVAEAAELSGERSSLLRKLGKIAEKFRNGRLRVADKIIVNTENPPRVSKLRGTEPQVAAFYGERLNQIYKKLDGIMEVMERLSTVELKQHRKAAGFGTKTEPPKQKYKTTIEPAESVDEGPMGLTDALLEATRNIAEMAAQVVMGIDLLDDLTDDLIQSIEEL